MITTYQIKNVLRVYSSQLKKKTTPIRDSVGPLQRSPDFVDISIKARRKQMLNQISGNLISQMVPKEYYLGTEEKSLEERPPVHDSGVGVKK